MEIYHLLFLLVLTTCLFLSRTVVSVDDIAVLTDSNFEHDTQATTGSTTGRWLVLFHAGNDASIRKMLTSPSLDASTEEGDVDEDKPTMVQALLEAGVVVGTMDVSTNPLTINRLKIPGAPHAVVLAKGKLWRTNSMEDIQDFAISEYEIGAAEDIPPLPSPLGHLMAHPEGKMAVMGLAGSLILFVILILARSMFQTKPEPPAVSHKKKN